MNHSYTVEFRIYSKTIGAARISQELGLTPSRTQPQGERRADGKELTGMWGYDGEEDGAMRDWESFEAGLTYLLDKLWPLKEKLAACAAGGELVWWCGHFQSSFDGGPSLSPTLLHRLGDFGATLYLDNYFSSAE